MRRRSLAVLLALAGCKPPVETELPICKSEVAGAVATEVTAGEIPADIWFAIVLSNYNRETREVRRPVLDCSGRPVEPDAGAPVSAVTCAVGESGAATLPARPLTEDDLLIVPTDDGRLLVWVKTKHFESGEALGPIAIAEWSARGVVIRAIGTLRAHADKAALRIEPLGAAKVLVVESRACKQDAPTDCTRMTRLLPLLGDRFVDQPLVQPDGVCIGPALFAMYRKQEIPLESGLVRSFQLSTSIEFNEGQAVVKEQVKIEDSDPAQPEAPPSLFRTANIQRPLELAQTGIVTKAGLWEAILQEHGSVALRPAEAGG